MGNGRKKQKELYTKVSMGKRAKVKSYNAPKVSMGNWQRAKGKTQVFHGRNEQREDASNLFMTTELLTNHESEPLIHRFEPHK
jgi:hypothetical protein